MAQKIELVIRLFSGLRHNSYIKGSAGIKLNNRLLVYDNVIGHLSNQRKIIIHTLQPCNSQLLLYLYNFLDCYEGDGASYRGRKTKTNRGRICQKWASQSPHKHDPTPEKQV